MSDNIVLVSADAHAGARPEAYRPYMDKLARDHFDEYVEDEARYTNAMSVFSTAKGTFGPDRLALIDKENRIGSGGLEGAWDVRRRLEEMDREGVAGEFLVHGHQISMDPFFAPSSRRGTPLDLRAAGLRAYHRWMADHLAEGDGRLVGMAEIAGVDMDATMAELRWCADHGFVAVQIPGLCQEPPLPPLFDAYYHPFWDLCSKTGLRLIIHSGWGLTSHGVFVERFEASTQADGFRANGNLNQTDRMAEMAKTAEGFFALDSAPRRGLWQLLVGGVFDRHPDLTLVLIEVRADWVPDTLRVFDERFARGDTPLKMKPSEYFQRNVYVAPSSPRRYEVDMRHEIGVDRFLFGRDYPHPEGTWPNTTEWIRAAFAGVPENEARRMLGENAIECFGFDRATMTKVAARIGPKPEAVLGDHNVDPALIEHFHLRAGYNGPAKKIDTDVLSQLLDENLTQLEASR
jgi:predicted TIM-barrel fold metal-dependent hydrolase